MLEQINLRRSEVTQKLLKFKSDESVQDELIAKEQAALDEVRQQLEEDVYKRQAFDIGVTLRDGDRQYFYQQLDAHFPGLKKKYMDTYGKAYEVGSPRRKELMKLFKMCIRDRYTHGKDLFNIRNCRHHRNPSQYSAPV